MFFALKKANIRTKPYKKEDKKVIYIGKIYKNAKSGCTAEDTDE